MSKIKVNIKRVYKVPDGRVQYKCIANLYDYLSNLKRDYFEFHIQRRIVKNTYLDSIYDTIKRLEPLPTITLSSVVPIEGEEGDESFVSMDDCELLDGLQRSFRLKAVMDIRDIIYTHGFQNHRDLRNYFNEESKKSIGYGSLEFVNTKFLRRMFEDGGCEDIIESYKQNEVELTIWTGLDESETIRQMMLLNAGQRPMTSTHQYEIVFLHFFDKGLLNQKNITLLRERDAQYFDVKRGMREKGQYLLASIIVALQSMILKKPLRITPANRLQIDPTDYLNQSQLNTYFNPDYLKKYINYIYRLDTANDTPEWHSWIAKDTTLSGIFAAIGYDSSSQEEEVEKIEYFVSIISSGEVTFNLKEFEYEYNRLSSVSVNVGNAVRKSIYTYTLALLNGNRSISWKSCFPQNKYGDENW